MLEHLPELSEENYSNLSAIKGSMTKVSAIDMNKELKKIVKRPEKEKLRTCIERTAWVILPSVIVVFTVVYLVIAVYFINQF